MNKILPNFTLFLFLVFAPSSTLIASQCPRCSDLRDDCLIMKTHGGGASGKWLDNVTPKRGWACTGAEDLGTGVTEECEMCEREQVRYIHLMTHGNQEPLELRVGCICSGHMEGSLDTEQSVAQAVATAQRRTANLNNRDKRRQNFPNLGGWKESKNGNPWIKKDGHWVTITSGKYGKYSAIVDKHPLNQWVDTIELAKFAAFDYLFPARVQQ